MLVDAKSSGQADQIFEMFQASHAFIDLQCLLNGRCKSYISVILRAFMEKHAIKYC